MRLKLVTLLNLTFALILTQCDEQPETLFILKSSVQTGITFNNRITETSSANILTEEYIFNGGGVAIGDFNLDGLQDIFFAGNQVPNKLYLNRSSFTFEDISNSAGIEAPDRWNTGATVVDINNDGLLDIYVCSAREKDLLKRANLLYVNQGNNGDGVPVFKELGQEFGIADDGNSMGSAFFDYDKDGDLDLYVINNEQTHILPTNYRKKVIDGSAVSNDRLYRNNNDGTFTDVTLISGITIEGFGLSVAIADLNYDNWPDIYVTNDYLTNDLLYINNGNGTFSNQIKSRIKHQSKFAMGCDIADYNNDGYLDIVTLDMLGATNQRIKTTVGGHNYINQVLNTRYEYEPQYMRNMLQLGNGPELPFSEIGLMAGVAKTDWSWSPLFIDVDNNGYRDLLITNGFPRDITDLDFSDFNLTARQFLSPEKILDSVPVVKIANYGFQNNGDLTFTDSSKTWGIDVPSFSNGAAFVDLDNDGDMDYVVNNINDDAFVFENTANVQNPQSSYLQIDLKGPEKNILGIGTKILVKYNGKIQYHEHQVSRGYMSSVDPTIHFGLGQQSIIDTLEILWPDGQSEKRVNISANARITVNYQDSSDNLGASANTSFTNKIPKHLMFEEISAKLGVDHMHFDNDVIDFNVQNVLPHKLSQNGPCSVVGDINADGLEDFLIGGSKGFPTMKFIQLNDGSFKKEPLYVSLEQLAFEVESMALFDIENDGDLDLYLVSGGNESESGSYNCQDRLLINDGHGSFSDSVEKIPALRTNGSVVAEADFDKDGFTDVFVGGRTPLGKYPIPEKSYLLKNINGFLLDVTQKLAPDLAQVGMVTDAKWVDVDNDGLKDLIIVGELMSIKVFKNKITKFELLVNTGLEKYLGWWEQIESGDFDNDGDMDFIVGNLGRNNFYQPSFERPMTVIAKDFDKNGSIDPVAFGYLKDTEGNYQSYPLAFWGDLTKQSPIFRAKFAFFREFAQSSEKTLLSEEQQQGALRLQGNYASSSYIENLGNGSFKIKALPLESQFAPINDILVIDINDDGNLDAVLIGNDFGNETFIGPYDALNGVVLLGSGNGSFDPIHTKKSGFLVSGDAKSIVQVKSRNGDNLIVVGQNKGKLLVFKKN